MGARNKRKTHDHEHHKSRGRFSVAETETITVSKRFANNLRELLFLLDEKRPIDEHCGWVLKNLVEQEASTVGERCDLISEMSPWETEAECQAFVDRVRYKFEKTAIFEIYENDKGKWDLAMFDSRYSHWHTIWKYCQQ